MAEFDAQLPAAFGPFHSTSMAYPSPGHPNNALQEHDFSSIQAPGEWPLYCNDSLDDPFPESFWLDDPLWEPWSDVLADAYHAAVEAGSDHLESFTRGHLNLGDFTDVERASASVYATEVEQKQQRFSDQQVMVLRQWLSLNLHNPFPSADAKQQLASASGLQIRQVERWFARTRARQLVRLAARTGSADHMGNPAVHVGNAHTTPVLACRAAISLAPSANDSSLMVAVASPPQDASSDKSLAKLPRERLENPSLVAVYVRDQHTESRGDSLVDRWLLSLPDAFEPFSEMRVIEVDCEATENSFPNIHETLANPQQSNDGPTSYEVPSGTSVCTHPPCNTSFTSGEDVAEHICDHTAEVARENGRSPALIHQPILTGEAPAMAPVEPDVPDTPISTPVHELLEDNIRKRNAGASARFRARRREKEKEAAEAISSLQQDLRDLRAERDFYQRERNFWGDFIGRTVGLDKLPCRPSSPASRVRQIPGLSEADSWTQDDEGGQPQQQPYMPLSSRKRAAPTSPAGSDRAMSVHSGASCSSYTAFGPRKGRRVAYGTSYDSSPPTPAVSFKAWQFGTEASVAHPPTAVFDSGAKSTGYSCAFCGKTFDEDWKWRRHESSMHAPSRCWVCGPALFEKLAESVASAKATGEAHTQVDCWRKPESDRTFFRRDHMKQHLLGLHKLDKNVKFERLWSSTAKRLLVPSSMLQCPVCENSLSTWGARCDHLQAHFSRGEGLERLIPVIPYSSFATLETPTESRTQDGN